MKNLINYINESLSLNDIKLNIKVNTESDDSSIINKVKSEVKNAYDKLNKNLDNEILFNKEVSTSHYSEDIEVRSYFNCYDIQFNYIYDSIHKKYSQELNFTTSFENYDIESAELVSHIYIIFDENGDIDDYGFSYDSDNEPDSDILNEEIKDEMNEILEKMFEKDNVLIHAINKYYDILVSDLDRTYELYSINE